MKALLSLALFATIPALASAQYSGSYVPNPTPLNYLPNYYNRSTQPLSPYLNLLRGGNPGVNYYYGVRPGLPSGGVNIYGQAPAYQPFVGAAAGGFLPQSGLPNEAPLDMAGKPVLLRSPSYAAVYGNNFGNHGVISSVYARSGQTPQGGLQRSSAQGVGAVPPPRTK